MPENEEWTGPSYNASVQVRVDKDLYYEMREHAKSCGMPVSRLLALAWRDYSERNPTKRLI